MFMYVFFSSRRRHTRCALVTGVQTCALPILVSPAHWASSARPLRSFPIFPGRREHCPWPSIPRFRYPEPRERSLGWRSFQCCFLWRRSSVRKQWHGEPMAEVCVMSFEIEVRRRIGDRAIRLTLGAGSGLTALFGHSGAGKTDRKSVVSVKSVSLGVDSVCGSTFKKKKKKGKN